MSYLGYFNSHKFYRKKQEQIIIIIILNYNMCFFLMGSLLLGQPAFIWNI